jgi:hypothetical protein
MDVSLAMCKDCGIIDFDFIFRRDKVRSDKPKTRLTCGKCNVFLRGIDDDKLIMNRRKFYHKYIEGNFRYRNMVADSWKLLLTIEWLIDNMDKEETEMFKKELEYIKSIT